MGKFVCVFDGLIVASRCGKFVIWFTCFNLCVRKFQLRGNINTCIHVCKNVLLEIKFKIRFQIKCNKTSKLTLTFKIRASYI